mmetsp:Transcript_19538/g.45442  ORF Transcript_19538/g.45442 Transcript_19538/m.45442 type:complete len:356 (+) Transcript_19538:51-1118(+)
MQLRPCTHRLFEIALLAATTAGVVTGAAFVPNPGTEVSVTVDSKGKLLRRDAPSLSISGTAALLDDAAFADHPAAVLLQSQQNPQDPPSAKAEDCNNVDAVGFNKKSSYSFGADHLLTFTQGESLTACAETCSGLARCDGFTFTQITLTEGECNIYEAGGTAAGHADDSRVSSYRKCLTPTTTEFLPQGFTVTLEEPVSVTPNLQDSDTTRNPLGSDSDDPRVPPATATSAAATFVPATQSTSTLEPSGSTSSAAAGTMPLAASLANCTNQDLRGYITQKGYRYGHKNALAVHYHETPDSCAGLCNRFAQCAAFTLHVPHAGAVHDRSECRLYSDLAAGEDSSDSDTSFVKCDYT